MVVEDPSDTGEPERILTEEEILELEQLPTSGTHSPSSDEVDTDDLEAEVEEAAGDYYRAAGLENWAYTYEHLDSETQSMFTREEWFQKNQYLADTYPAIYHILSVELDGSGDTIAEVEVRLTGEDGSTSIRNTYFVYEDGAWKHRFAQEEIDLFMPGVSFGEFVAARG